MLVVFSACNDELPVPDPSFRIEKDTIINSLKQRIEITSADTINPIYFVYDGGATFNTVWPGDRYKSVVSVNYSPTEKNKRVQYYIEQDYDSRMDSVILSLVMKRDTAWSQAAIIYQGIALPYGTNEIQYTFRSKGDLTVTWISRNANADEANEQIMQKKIRVR
jgi:hypothetical protein